MSTTAQIKANRQNAQKSTGPKTEEGKAVVSQNAVKHGIFAESVIKGENEADYEAFHDQLLAELVPVGTMETMLAERVVNLWWRLRRAERMQNEAIDEMIECDVTNPSARRRRERHYYDEGIRPGDPRFDLDHLPLGRITTIDWSNCRVLDRMLMYERRIENSVIKITKELKRFQVMRRIELEDADKQREPSPSLPDEAATGCEPARKNTDLKKQSQFAVIQVGAKSYLKREYDKNPAGEVEENKANRTCPEHVERSQFHAAEPTGPAGKMEKPVAAMTV